MNKTSIIKIGKLPDTIRSGRLLLRAPQTADAGVLQKLANNEKIHRMLARLPYPYEMSDALDFLDRVERDGEERVYAIINEDGDLAGIISLRSGSGPAPELGYWLGEPYWGRGYASEAVRIVLEAAGRVGIGEIMARSITENIASLRVLKRAGFAEISRGIDDCGQHEGICVTKMQWKGRHG